MKKIIIFLIIVIIICIISVIIVIRNVGNLSEKNIYSNYEYYQIENIGDYYLIKNCLNNFYYNYYLSCKDNLINNKNYILDILDSNIINKYQINKDNIIEILGETDKVSIQIDNIKYTSNENIFFYYVIGTLQNEDTKYINNFKSIVILDYNNMSYSMVLEKYMDDFKYEDIINSISINENNKFILPSISTEKYINDIFNEIRNNILYNQEKAYNTLNISEIINEFKDYNKFKKFIEENRKNIYLMTFSGYSIDVIEKNTIYNCKDKNNKFNVKIIITGPFIYNYSIEKI